MMTGALTYTGNDYYSIKNFPVEGAHKSIAAVYPRSQISGEKVQAETTVLPVSRETAEKAKIYTSNKIRINDYMLASAVSTKSSSASIRFSADAAGASVSAKESTAARATEPYTGCGACESRVYQDGSDDSGVSYQAAKGMPASMSGVMVAAHEGEHVTRETARAFEEGNTITQQKVTMQVAFCPECHRMYYAGGTTTVSAIESTAQQDQGDISVHSAANALYDLGNAIDLMI